MVLGVASATNNSLMILVAGIAATLAETISMTAVEYTSTKAEMEYYESERKNEERESVEVPDEEKAEIRSIYAKKGFKGKILEQIVKKITSNKKIWVDTMMTEELNLSRKFDESPLKASLVVFISTLLGSLAPIIPFVFMPVASAIVASLAFCVAILFAMGAMKGKLTMINWFRSGLELALIGSLAAAIGYFVGLGLSAIFGTSISILG